MVLDVVRYVRAELAAQEPDDPVLVDTRERSHGVDLYLLLVAATEATLATMARWLPSHHRPIRSRSRAWRGHSSAWPTTCSSPTSPPGGRAKSPPSLRCRLRISISRAHAS